MLGVTDEILALAAVLTGAKEQEQAALQLLCTAAEQEVLNGLKDGCDRESCREVCICAAAWLAAAGLLTGRAATGDGGSFKVGEVSVSGGDGQRLLQVAACLRQQAEQLMMPYAKDGGFAFLEVAG